MATETLGLKNDWSDTSPEPLSSEWLNSVADALDALATDPEEGLTLEDTAAQVEGLKRVVRRLLAQFVLTLGEVPPGLDAWLATAMEEYGGLVHEQEFLTYLTKDEPTQNNLHFLLVLGAAFEKLREDEFFHHRWTVDPNYAKSVHRSLENLCSRLSENDLLSEGEMITKFLEMLQ